MEIFEKISKHVVKTYTETTDKTGQIAKETKNKFKISSLKNEVIDRYEEIGKKVYESYRIDEEKDISQELILECINIDEINEKIRKLENEVLEMKHKKKCINCFAKIKDTDKYCFNCGQIQDIKNVNVNEEDIKSSNEQQKTSQEVEKSINEIAKTIQIESNINTGNNIGNNTKNVSESQSQNKNQYDKELDTVFTEKDISELENIIKIESNIDEELKAKYEEKQDKKEKEDKENK